MRYRFRVAFLAGVRATTAAMVMNMHCRIALMVLVSATLLPSHSALAQFSQQGPMLGVRGYSVSLSGDGNTAIFGGADYYGGHAWVWTRSGGVWTQQGPKLVGSGAVGETQGDSVSLSADGNTAIVGGWADDCDLTGSLGYGCAGAAWVWTRSGGVWTQQGAKLVGSGAAGLANQSGSVSLSADGNTAIVGGARDNNSAGAAWVWTRSGGVWTQQGTKLVGSGAVGGYSRQGSSVSLSADGNTAIVGGYTDNSYAGAAWVWTRSGGVWTQQGTKLVGSGAAGMADQGNSVSLSGDGNTAIVGGYTDNDGIGAAWVWTRSGGVWTQQGTKLVGLGAVGSNTRQSSSVSLSGDGNTAIVGGPNDNDGIGAAWVWTRSGGVWTQLGAKLVGSKLGGDPPYGEGNSVSLSGDGNTAIVGNGLYAWVFVASASPSQFGSWVLPSSAFRGGVNGAEFHTDVRILNLGTSPVTVTATFYDQESGTAVPAPGFPVEGRSQASFDNVLQSLFGKTLANGSYGPIRFASTGPITVSSSVNNVNACGTGATSGQWLPGIDATKAMTAGAIPQLAVSTSTLAGYRTNLVVMNPGSATATANVKVRAGGGVLISSGTVGPLGANGFSQVPLDSAATFPGVAGTTDTDLWVEFTSDQPVLAFASVINNASGDPFAVVAAPDAGGGASGSWVLPSSAFRAGLNGAEFHTDVRILNLGTSPVTVTATFYDQESGTAVPAPGFPVEGRSQASFDNVLQSLFGRTLASGSYGPIRFASTGPITVSSSVNNVNACGTGATSGQWLPGIDATKAMTAGAIPQLAVSTSTSAGYRTNLVVMNPGSANATATVKVRAGGGALLSSGTIGPLGANGFSQVPLDSAATFPGVAGTTDTNLWVEFTSNQPVLAFASVINNASGDPFAVVATPEVATYQPIAVTGFNQDLVANGNVTPIASTTRAFDVCCDNTFYVKGYANPGGAVLQYGATRATMPCICRTSEAPGR